MKYAVVILDGAAGRPLTELGDKTTLEAAHTPNLDALASEGLVGLARTVPSGREASSAVACSSILGYDAIGDHFGRGAIEAASMGVALRKGETALRLNLVTLASGKMKSYSAGNISTEESHEIATALAEALDDRTFTLHPGVGYRHILVVEDHAELISLKYTPPHDITDKLSLLYMPRGGGAQVLLDYMNRARQVLAGLDVNARRVARGDLPATDVWPFWPGFAGEALLPFAEKFGVTAALTSGVDLLNGLAVMMDIDRLEIAGVTAGADNDYAAQAEGALAALGDHDLVVIHVESPDEEGHVGDVAGKVAAIEAIDREVIARLRAFDEDLRVLAMPDHPTPIEIKTHDDEPVPFVLWGPGIEPDDATCYNERAGAEAELLVLGTKLMGMLIVEPEKEETEATPNESASEPEDAASPGSEPVEESID